MANKGLQPVCLFLAIFPSIFCVGLVAIRIFMRLRKDKLGIGKPINTPRFVLVMNRMLITHYRRHIFDFCDSRSQLTHETSNADIRLTDRSRF
jgi:hypothetical protein